MPTSETSPLLHSRRTVVLHQERNFRTVGANSDRTRYQSENVLDRPKDLTHDFWPHSKLSILLASSFPLVCIYILQFSLVAITLSFVGRLGKGELAGVSLACLTANVTGWSVFKGLALAFDMLCPHTYEAELKSIVGLHMQRMAMLL